MVRFGRIANKVKQDNSKTESRLRRLVDISCKVDGQVKAMATSRRDVRMRCSSDVSSQGHNAGPSKDTLCRLRTVNRAITLRWADRGDRRHASKEQGDLVP